MSFLKLSPLQARFAASFGATLFLIILYVLVFGPQLAYAIDDELIPKSDHNHPIPLGLNVTPILEEGTLGGAQNGLKLEDEDIVRRQSSDPVSLSNNTPKRKEIEIGETQNWVFKADSSSGPRSPPPRTGPRASYRFSDESNDEKRSEVDDHEAEDEDDKLSRRANRVYITANTCMQPSLSAPQVSTDAGPPQLRLYISQSSSVEKPGPDVDDPDMTVVEFDGGYVHRELGADGDVYIGIEAPNNTRYSGGYDYEIAVSIDNPFHSVESGSPFLLFVDSDSDSALLHTYNTTQVVYDNEAYKEWMTMDPLPFTMFAHGMNDTAILGLDKSYCGLKLNSQIKNGSKNIGGGMTSRGINHKPKQQFFVRELNQSTSYYGFLAMEGNSTASGDGVVGGGGKVWTRMNFTTKAADNCAIIYDLEFCSDVAYAVPSNPSLDINELKGIYDRNAANLFKNFTYSLQQIPCNTSDSSQYSLARNCTNCRDAYKQWLCTVTIPRCHDFSSELGHLQTRNAGQKFTNGTLLPDEHPARQSPLTNSSRNRLIDTEIQPGPYKEMLPCQELCFELVRSCPAALGFGCPVDRWLNASYGVPSRGLDLTCSFPGAAFPLSEGHRIGDWQRQGVVMLSMIAFWSFFWVLDV